MTFEEKIQKCPPAEVWQEYCGFLDLSMEEYMAIQKRLLMEQITLMDRCALGRRFFGGNPPKTVEEFRRRVPLTSFGDYADVLLTKREEMLPAKPVVWLRTTWEGGDFPAKYAPYTESMLDTYKRNMLGAVLLATSSGRGKFKVRPGSRILYSLAPLPYATGLFPDLIEPELRLRFLPSVREARRLSFGEQNRRGYKLALQYGMNMFFGMSSVLYGTTRNLEQMNLSSKKRDGSGGMIRGISPLMLWRLLSGRYRSKRDGRPLLPRDLFRLDGFVCIERIPAVIRTNWKRHGASARWNWQAAQSRPVLGPRPGAKMGSSFSRMRASMNLSRNPRCCAVSRIPPISRTPI